MNILIIHLGIQTLVNYLIVYRVAIIDVLLYSIVLQLGTIKMQFVNVPSVDCEFHKALIIWFGNLNDLL